MRDYPSSFVFCWAPLRDKPCGIHLIEITLNQLLFFCGREQKAKVRSHLAQKQPHLWTHHAHHHSGGVASLKGLACESRTFIITVYWWKFMIGVVNYWHLKQHVFNNLNGHKLNTKANTWKTLISGLSRSHFYYLLTNFYCEKKCWIFFLAVFT